jgi:hypothetical protein
MVWHHRRSTVKAYLKQQRGYGEAEALLKRNHPEKFQGFRADLSWRGHIYTRAGVGVKLGRPVIHFGPFASGLFQTIYSPPQVWWPLLATSLEWWIAMALLLGLALVAEPKVWLFHSWTVWNELGNPLVFTPVSMALVSLAVAYLVAGQASPPVHQRRWWSRLLIAAMHLLQPVARGWARYQARFRTRHLSEAVYENARRWRARVGGLLRRRRLELWSEDGVGRDRLLERLVAFARAQGANLKVDSGWEPHDVTFRGNRWWSLEITTVTEEHGGGKRLTRVRTRRLPAVATWVVLGLTAYLGVFVWLWEPDWEAFMLAPLAALAWFMGSSFLRLQRVAVASVLSVAEALGMTVVGAADALRPPLPAAEAAPPGKGRTSPPAP